MWSTNSLGRLFPRISREFLSHYYIWVKFWRRVRCNCHFLLSEDRKTSDPLKRCFTWRCFSDNLVFVGIATFEMSQYRRFKRGKRDIANVAREMLQTWKDRCFKRGKRDVANVAREMLQTWQDWSFKCGKWDVGNVARPTFTWVSVFQILFYLGLGI